MRLDKWLKVSRLIKRRTVAQEACDGGRVSLNGRVAKPSADVKEGDVIEISFGAKKVRAEVLSVAETVRTMEQHAEGGREYSGKCFVCHSNCLADAEQTAEALRARFPKMQPIRICDIGCIIAAHAGPGTVAAFFLGDARAPEK